MHAPNIHSFIHSWIQAKHSPGLFCPPSKPLMQQTQPNRRTPARGRKTLWSSLPTPTLHKQYLPSGLPTCIPVCHAWMCPASLTCLSLFPPLSFVPRDPSVSSLIKTKHSWKTDRQTTATLHIQSVKRLLHLCPPRQTDRRTGRWRDN